MQKRLHLKSFCSVKLSLHGCPHFISRRRYWSRCSFQSLCLSKSAERLSIRLSDSWFWDLLRRGMSEIREMSKFKVELSKQHQVLKLEDGHFWDSFLLLDLGRLKALERAHVLDEASRNRRQKKAIDALEKDNFQENLSSSTIYVSEHRLQLNRKLQQRFNVANEDDSTTNKDSSNHINPSSCVQVNLNTSGDGTTAIQDQVARKRKLRPEARQLKFARKNFTTLSEEEHELTSNRKFNYFSITVPPSRFPARKFCSVCGFVSSYVCVQCGTKYCSSKCLQTHKDTR